MKIKNLSLVQEEERRGVQVYMLQTQDFRVSQEEEHCISINIRELNKELCTKLFILYTLD